MHKPAKQLADCRKAVAGLNIPKHLANRMPQKVVELTQTPVEPRTGYRQSARLDEPPDQTMTPQGGYSKAPPTHPEDPAKNMPL